MPHTKKILLISPQPFFEARGTPINVREILNSLSEKGYQVTLLTYPFGEDVLVKNVNIIRSYRPPFIKSVKIGPSLEKIILDIFLSFKALTLSLKNHYHLYHGIEEAGLVAGTLGILFKRPFIVDVDSAMSHQLEESGFIKSKFILRAFEKLESYFFNRANGVITVCESLTQEVKKLSPKAKIYQIEDFPLETDNNYNLHETNYPLKEKLSLDNDKKIILYAGNFEPYQGINLLIESFAYAYNTEKNNAQLVLVGGSLAQINQYKELSKLLGVDNLVSFTGPIEPKYMQDLYSQADVLVSPRLTGTNTPLKIYSYLNSEKPVVATNIYSHTQVMNNEIAYLANANLIEFGKSLIDALSDNSDDKNTRKIKITKAKELIDQKYSKTCFKKRILDTYEEIIFIEQKINPESIAARTDVPPDVASSSHEYANRFAGDIGQYFLNTQSLCCIKAISPLLINGKAKPGAKVLEIGGGHCQLTQVFLDLGFEVTIQGSDERSFIRAKDLGFNKNKNVKFLECSLYEILAQNNEFDLVSGIRLMAHVSNWQDFLKEIWRVSSNGVLIDYANIYTVNIISPIFFPIKKYFEKNTRPFICFKPSEINNVFYNLGANQIYNVPQFIIPMGLHRVINSVQLTTIFEKILNKTPLKKFATPIICFAAKNN